MGRENGGGEDEGRVQKTQEKKIFQGFVDPKMNYRNLKNIQTE